jgi:hypothetical protein
MPGVLLPCTRVEEHFSQINRFLRFSEAPIREVRCHYCILVMKHVPP